MREKHYYLTEERVMLFSHLHLESMPTEYRGDVIIDSFENRNDSHLLQLSLELYALYKRTERINKKCDSLRRGQEYENRKGEKISRYQSLY